MSFKQTLLLGYVLILFLILVVRPVEAQPSRLDSLISVLDQNDLDQGERVFTLGRLAAHHYFEGNKVAGDQRMEEALALAQGISDKQYLARTYAIQAMQLRIQGQTEKAWQALASSLDAEKDIQNFSVKGYVWYAKGWMETRDDLNDKPIESLFRHLVSIINRTILVILIRLPKPLFIMNCMPSMGVGMIFQIWKNMHALVLIKPVYPAIQTH